MELTALTVANIERSERGSDLARCRTMFPPIRSRMPASSGSTSSPSGRSSPSTRKGADRQWGEKEQSKHTPDPFAGPWNHWPVGLNPSDGRYAVSTDRVTHAALGGARPTGSTIIHGFTDQPAASLAALAKSWNHPPAVEDVRRM